VARTAGRGRRRAVRGVAVLALAAAVLVGTATQAGPAQQDVLLEPAAVHLGMLGPTPAPDPASLRVEWPLGGGPDPVVVPAPEPAPAEAPAPVQAGGTRAARPAAAPVAAAPVAAPQGVLPLPVNAGSSRQVVTVAAPSAGATTATLTAWQLGPAGWTPALGPVSARIGSRGVGQASESTTRTPAGTFPLTEAFGRAGNPGTALPYRLVDGDDWWVSDTASPLYNRYAECAPQTCPFDERAGENLAAAGAVYDQAVVIDYNRAGTPGAGSAFFLHVTNGAPTAGCVAIDAASLTAVMRWLDPGARPLIAIGVG
jgi:L,D-peptidoglycan transpeptidase YkuD (ErfK/YbiS/YcfS/YnhG family)